MVKVTGKAAAKHCGSDVGKAVDHSHTAAKMYNVILWVTTFTATFEGFLPAATVATTMSASAGVTAP